MPRDHGWLKEDALKTAGIKEQWSAITQTGRVSVEMGWSVHGYVIQTHEPTEFLTVFVGDDLRRARRVFRSEVKKHGGKV